MLDFYHLNSSCSTAVKATLELTGEPHQVVPVDLSNKSEAFLRVNPLGKVPALDTGAEALFEGGAINLWLAARHPEAGLMPDLASIEGAEALKWLFFVYASLHPVWARLFLPERYGDAAAKDSVTEKAKAQLFDLYALIDAQLAEHPFVAGKDMTLADLYLVATIHWEKALDGAVTARFPRLAEHRDRVLSHPVVRKAFRGEFGYA